MNLDYLKSKINKLRQGTFVRNVMLVASGTAIAQAINMAFSPIITRLYGPESFGLLGIFLSLFAIVSPVAALTYPGAIVLSKDDLEAKGMASLSAFVAVAVAGALAIGLFFCSEELLSLIGSREIGTLVFLLPLAVLFAAFVQIAQQWLIRKKQFNVTARVAVVQSLVINSAKAGFGLFQPVGSVLIAIATAGQAIHAFMLSLGAKRADKTVKFFDSSVERSSTSLLELARRYRDFPMYRAPQAFLNPVSQSFPVLMLASFFGPAAAGFYTLSRAVMGVPSQLISASVGNVLYPRLAEAANRNEKLAPMIVKSTLGLLLVGIIPFGTIAAFGPWVFGFVFGVEWINAGSYARWLSIWTFAGFINAPSVKSLPVLSLLPLFLKYEISSLVLRISVLIVGFYTFSSDIVAIALFSIAGALLNTALILVVITKAHKLDRNNLTE